MNSKNVMIASHSCADSALGLITIVVAYIHILVFLSQSTKPSVISPPYKCSVSYTFLEEHPKTPRCWGWTNSEGPPGLLLEQPYLLRQPYRVGGSCLTQVMPHLHHHAPVRPAPAFQCSSRNPSQRAPAASPEASLQTGTARGAVCRYPIDEVLTISSSTPGAASYPPQSQGSQPDSNTAAFSQDALKFKSFFFMSLSIKAPPEISIERSGCISRRA
jgi:hypothetical protein